MQSPYLWQDVGLIMETLNSWGPLTHGDPPQDPLKAIGLTTETPNPWRSSAHVDPPKTPSPIGLTMGNPSKMPPQKRDTACGKGWW